MRDLVENLCWNPVDLTVELNVEPNALWKVPAWNSTHSTESLSPFRETPLRVHTANTLCEPTL